MNPNPDPFAEGTGVLVWRTKLGEKPSKAIVGNSDAELDGAPGRWENHAKISGPSPLLGRQALGPGDAPPPARRGKLGAAHPMLYGSAICTDASNQRSRILYDYEEAAVCGEIPEH
jgi:hypothetical protein